jgi:hypothetical protein
VVRRLGLDADLVVPERLSSKGSTSGALSLLRVVARARAAGLVALEIVA